MNGEQLNKYTPSEEARLTEERGKSDKLLREMGAKRNEEDDRLVLTDSQMENAVSMNICEKCKAEIKGIKLQVSYWGRELGYSLEIGEDFSCRIAGESVEEIEPVFEFAKKLAEEGDEAEVIFKRVEQFVSDKEKERGK
jgi:hypothetical protein